MENKFLPICKKDLDTRGWDACDIILITGDHYIDHHSNGAAIIGRVLESEGYKVGIISRPDLKKIDDFKVLGRPKLFFGITSGNLDSMVANYTANKRKRRDEDKDKNPDRALIVYTNKVREAYKGTNIVIGGIEASMRRLAHYDYWTNKVRRSIILDARANILVYGMGERAIKEIASRLKNGENINELNDIRGTVISRNNYDFLKKYVNIPSFKEVENNYDKFNRAYKLFYDELSPNDSLPIVQQHGDKYVIQLKPQLPMTEEEMDKIYELPYMREQHPKYKYSLKSFDMVKYSITSHRGCSGECNFCSLGLHQGRIVQSRSEKSILKEIQEIIKKDYFNGTIRDIGGPTANLYKAKCFLWEKGIICKRKNCLGKEKCKNLKLGYDKHMELLSKIRSIPGIKHVFISSGIRYDLLIEPSTDKYFLKLLKNHISGQMKVAPEHVSDNVLELMNKPSHSFYKKFVKRFNAFNKQLKKKQFLVNYFITSHPGTKAIFAIELVKYCNSIKINPEQIQDYTPLPMTVSSCMYYTGLHPLTNKKVYVPKGDKERNMQRSLLQKKNTKRKKYIPKHYKK